MIDADSPVKPARTFQVGFIISICLGAGVGEAMFGRFMASASAAH